MCQKCNAIDGEIAHYLTIAGRISDQRTLDGINELITEMMQARKAALHPK